MSESAEEKLESIHHGIERCLKCRLHETRTHAVPGEGPAEARCMFVGEAPGAREDECGRPFVGMAGEFFGEVLADTGMDRDSVYITSVVKCRPPENRNPRADEAATCIDAWLDDQIALVDPEIIVVLGGVAFKAIFDEDTPLNDAHGQVREHDGRRWLITYHPAAAMRFPELRKRILDDLRHTALQRVVGGGDAQTES
ncbi:MAG: uracil-DNA glycosylase [Armatimonadota bacterium]